MKHLTSLFRTLRALIRLARARLQRRERIRREKFASSLKRSIHIPSKPWDDPRCSMGVWKRENGYRRTR